MPFITEIILSKIVNTLSIKLLQNIFIWPLFPHFLPAVRQDKEQGYPSGTGTQKELVQHHIQVEP